jgi:hypothetical protein
LDFNFYSVTSLNVTVASVGIVFCVILYFLFFLFVIGNSQIGLSLYKLCSLCPHSAIAFQFGRICLFTTA